MLCILFLIAFSVGTEVSGQYTLDGFSLDGSVADWYDSKIGSSSSSLYEGTFYGRPRIAQVGHALFRELSWAAGTITFNGQYYDSVQIVYDILEDLVIIRNPNLSGLDQSYLKINQNLISSFSLHGVFFKKLKGATTPASGDGFYEMTYEGATLSLVVKRRKVEKFDGVQIELASMDEYYLFYQGSYIDYKGKKTLLQVFPNFKKPIRIFLRNNQLRIKPGDDRQIISAIKYCEHLIEGNEGA